MRKISVPQMGLAVETVVYAALLLVIFTGRRAGWLDNLGSHADTLAALVLLAAFALFHRFARTRVLPRIEQHFYPKPYEERRIFSGLGQEARTATSIDQLYGAIVRRIAESFEADEVSILVRSDKTGNYHCAASSSQSGISQLSEHIQVQTEQPSELKLSREAFIVKRLNHLSAPLVIDKKEIETWSRALESGPSHLRQSRMLEQKTLRTLKSHLLVQVRTKEQMIGILSLGLRRGHFGYSNADRETIVSVAGQLALVIENSRLAERMVIQERLQWRTHAGGGSATKAASD